MVDVPPERMESATQLHALLGVDVERCVAALKATHDDMEAAANRLLTGGPLEEIEDIEAPVQLIGNLAQRYRRVEQVGAVLERAERIHGCRG